MGSKELFLTVVSLVVGSSVLAGQNAELTITGTVSPDCDIEALPSDVSLGDLQQNASRQITFDFNCNAPFRYELSSENGALTHETLRDVTGFLHALEYDIDVRLPTDSGPGIQQTVASADVGPGGAAPAFANSGSEIALNQQGSLTVSWDAPGIATTRPLLAGRYDDRLTLTISADL